MEPQLHLTKHDEVHRAKWLILNSTSHPTPHTGWEYVTRTTKLKDAPDGASLIPILKFPDGPPRLCLIANYRPPVKKYMLEFPAGL
jgi:ADP-ribose pyrophosphatase